MASMDAPGGTTGWALSAISNPAGKLSYYTKNLSSRAINCTIPLAKTYFVAVHAGANQTLAVYLNGRLVGSQYGGQAVAPLIGPGLYIGAASIYAGALDGTIGECAVYDYALTADQILRHYSAGMGATPSFSGMLDAIPATRAGAWSLRRLRNQHTGPCVNVRRDADQSACDIGFTPAGDLDVATLLAFTGSGNGYVTTWYDQSGNGAALVQANTAAQPQIVNAGALIRLQGRVAHLRPAVHACLSVRVRARTDRRSTESRPAQQSSRVRRIVRHGRRGHVHVCR